MNDDLNFKILTAGLQCDDENFQHKRQKINCKLIYDDHLSNWLILLIELNFYFIRFKVFLAMNFFILINQTFYVNILIKIH